MQRMVKLRRAIQVSTVGTVGLALSLSISCVRSEPSAPTDGIAPASSKQELPFHPDSEQTSAQDSQSTVSEPKLVGGLPFRNSAHSRVVPAGTLLTVQLVGSLSTARVHAGDEFTATLAAPLMIDGEILLPRGTAVTGRVESAESQPDQPGSRAGSGYFRLTLSAIAVERRTVPLQTSSLFARAASTQQPHLVSNAHASASSSNDIRIQKGHPLTFRLATPVVLDDPDSAGNRQTPTRAAE